jgi:hypothetical protein
VGPRAGMDDMQKRKFLSNSDPLVVQPVASGYTDCAISDPINPSDKRKTESVEMRFLTSGSCIHFPTSETKYRHKFCRAVR